MAKSPNHAQQTIRLPYGGWARGAKGLMVQLFGAGSSAAGSWQPIPSAKGRRAGSRQRTRYATGKVLYLTIVDSPTDASGEGERKYSIRYAGTFKNVAQVIQSRTTLGLKLVSISTEMGTSIDRAVTVGT